ncbi:MAG TPA: hypothetical protein VG123_17250 [Streptosporangiaceae bacterium]|jgi:hypothetical protein|nr:hypothetical protein [Streptosporangiaceae bacterium]
MAAYLPPGWPAGVHPPGSQDFERTAVAWLLDVAPPDYRLYGVLRRHPAALASLARHHLTACVEGARQGYRTARTELGDALPPHGLDAVLAAYRSEGRRLVATANAVGLVERALRGETFTPRLRDSRPGAGPAGPPPAAGAPASARTPAGTRPPAPVSAAVGARRRDVATAPAAAKRLEVATAPAAARPMASNGTPAGNGRPTSNKAASSKTASIGKTPGTVNRAGNGKAAGNGKPARNGKAASSGKAAS